MAETFAGSRLYIGTTAPAATKSEFEADVYTEIKELSNAGDIGASANVLTFPLVSDDYVKKSKGARNAGDPVIVVGRDPLDPGQILVRAAEADKYYRNFKLVIADARSEHYTDSILYFRALVVGVPRQFGGQEDFVTESYTLGIYPKPIEVPSAFVTSP